MRYERKNFQFLKNAHIGLEAAFLRSYNHQARAFHNRVNDNQNLIAGCAFVMRHRRFGDFEKFRFSPRSHFIEREEENCKTALRSEEDMSKEMINSKLCIIKSRSKTLNEQSEESSKDIFNYAMLMSALRKKYRAKRGIINAHIRRRTKQRSAKNCSISLRKS